MVLRKFGVNWLWGCGVISKTGYWEGGCLLLACLVVGRSEEENCRKLEAVARTAFEWGDNNAVAFDNPKTELIHFHQNC